jgi:hypothetical protein
MPPNRGCASPPTVAPATRLNSTCRITSYVVVALGDGGEGCPSDESRDRRELHVTQAATGPSDPALYAGGAVDALPEQVGVAVVAGVLLDHVDVDPAEVDVLLQEAASVG